MHCVSAMKTGLKQCRFKKLCKNVFGQNIEKHGLNLSSTELYNVDF